MQSEWLSRVGIACLIGMAASAQAQVVNGSLNGPIFNGGVPTGWEVEAGSPDTMNAGANAGVPGLGDFGAFPDASPDGGTWVGLGRDDSQSFVERFGQTLTGLTAGQTYAVSWVAGNFGYAPDSFGYINPNAVAMLIDGTLVGAGDTIMLGSQWHAQSLTFVASAGSQLLSFQLADGAKSYMSIDGISVSAVPEPAAIVLMLAGLGLLGLRARHLR